LLPRTVDKRLSGLDQAEEDYTPIEPANIWNFDKIGLRIGVLRGRLVYTYTEIDTVVSTNPDERTLVTIN
jgi:hypothetical protein